MKTVFFILLTSFSFGQNGFGELAGATVDEKGEPLPFVKAFVYSSESENKEIVGGGLTDFDGRFRISALPKGNYTIEVFDISSGTDTIQFTNVEILENQITFLDTIIIEQQEFIYCDFGYSPPIKTLLDPFGGPTIIKQEDIRIMY